MPDMHALPGHDEGTVYRTLFAAYPDALVLVGSSGRIVMANPAATELLGYTRTELIGLNVDALVPHAIRPRHAAYRAAYAEKPHTRPMGTQMDLVALRKDGSEVMVEIALSPLQERGLPYVVAAIRGVGAYPRVKQALQRARYSEQVAALGRLAVDTRDPQTLMAAVSRSAVETLAIAHAAVCLLEPNGQDWQVAAHHGDGPSAGTQLPQAAGQLPGRLLAQPAAVVLADSDGGSTAGVPLNDRGRVVGALLLHSRQAQRFGDDEMRFADALASLLSTSLQRHQSEEALHHAQRLESVGQLTGGIAHDFNNLLTIISGNLQVLEDLPAVAGDTYAGTLVAAAARATRRGAELTAKLLAFSRRQVLQPTEVDVATMLHSLADMLKRTLDQRIRISVLTDPGLPACQADPGQLESALLNIAINARDAMPDGGDLCFAAHAVAVLPDELSADTTPSGGYVEIQVRDTGTGMPDAVLERAFEPFYTTKESGRGTGLGLSTVYGFVKQSHGAVALQSAPGAGTTVSLYIPGAARPQGSAVPTAATELLPQGLRVLLVEDDAEVRTVAQRFLAAMGCSVSVCATAEEALPLLDGALAFDLLASDIALGPGLRGTELARRAQARHPQLAVLLMSGYSNELLDPADAAALRWPLLAKPYTREALAAAVAKALAA